MDTIFIVTEANERVATGHLIECIACVDELLQNEYEVSFWINDNMGEGLKKGYHVCFMNIIYQLKVIM